MLLAGVEATVLNGGAVLCHPEWPVPLVSRVTTRLLILDVSRPILRGQQVRYISLQLGLICPCLSPACLGMQCRQ